MLFCSNYAKNYASTIRHGLFEPQHSLFSEEETIHVRAGKDQWKQKVRDFAVKPDHEYEENNFIVTLFKIVMNHNSYISSKLWATTLTVLLIMETSLMLQKQP